MYTRALRPKHGDCGVETTFPKEILKEDDVLDADVSEEELSDALEDAQLRYNRLGFRTYVVRIQPGDDDRAEPIEECRPIRQLAASMAFGMESPGSTTRSRSD